MSPLYADRVAAALVRKGAAFDESQSGIQADMQSVQEALTFFEQLTCVDIERRLAGIERPGARPTVEQDTRPLIMRFGADWNDHRAARDWAAATLDGVTTFAVDGSQIFPSDDMSIPVGLVQVGWFENRHDPAGNYVKDVEVEVLSPLDLVESFEPGFAEREIEWRRFSLEVARTLTFMEEHRNLPALVFFDGSLILSFVATMRESRQREYSACVRQMLAVSEETGVPLVGFIDSSRADDLTTLVRHVIGYSGGRMGDAAALRSRMGWGDRSRLFVCSRDDKVLDGAYYEQVLFTYLKTTRDHPPARVELPAWVFAQGRHEWVLDVVRAECVVGVGYPYPLETADAVAVLSMQDRERFYRLFQDFAARRGIPVRFSRKSISKRGRRI